MEMAVTAIISAMMATNSVKPGPDRVCAAGTSWTGGLGRIAIVTIRPRAAKESPDGGAPFAARLWPTCLRGAAQAGSGRRAGSRGLRPTKPAIRAATRQSKPADTKAPR